MTNLDPFYEFRGQMVARLTRDLLGPSEDEEELEDLPLDHYVVGVLYPRIGDTIDPAEDDELGEDEDEPTVADPPVALANTRYPSSAGLTFAVDTAACDRLLVDVDAARYVPVENENRRRWRRSPSAIRDLEVEVSRPISGRWLELGEGLALFVKVRGIDDEGAASVTLTLVNTREASAGQRDVDAFFQPSISVRASDDSAAFVARRSRAADVDDADLRSYRLLYRHAKTFAIGHGCAADWDREDVADRATRVFTTFLPQHELLLADSNPAIQSLALGLKFLATGERRDVVGALTHFCGLYQEWIDARAEEIHLLPAGLQGTAAEHVTACRECLSRMRSGIDELDGEVWTAFQLANLAMWNQRTRATWIRAGKPTPQPIPDDTPQWRPFQLAFILQCLRGLAEPSHEDREIADLLWFPTGGGKTEAYLGLIAFTVFLRRLRSADGDGVTVLMRYTLRLLTLQQFERAALLISACEQIRRAREDLGGSEISIGLWIGQAGTPNALADARTALTNLRDGREVLEGNPLQLRSCPWCGSELGPFQYEITTEPRMLIRCRDKTCEFARGLPVYLVDEDVYRRRPTLIIATVDKFATMPWRQETAALFNRRSASPPPELIVQDELHLISGPLGTLAGLYETAVDLLCTERGIPPKVVASTATIRRAEEQARGLFMRAMRQFPPPGLDAGDSWFAVEAPADAKGTRRYIGAMAPGKSHATLMIRAYVSLLQSGYAIEGDAQARDPYWTLVGYFNSLRVLGGARMQVQDDVREQLPLVAGDEGPRELEPDNRIELTSRESSADIPSHLARMETRLPDPDTLDVILATNMISVGVDIDRLGLMAMMGQPQSASEYIQATSRVGRAYPGLIVTLLNAARSRDRSHYEAFKTFHSALYRQVESTSVTPFSPRSRDRGLHAVLIALARITIPDLAENGSAGQIGAHRGELELLVERILERVRSVEPEAEQASRAQLERTLAEWESRAAQVSDLRYSGFRDTLDHALLISAADADKAQLNMFPTLWSLRDVDQESNLYLTRGG
jgi:hypothetical protein